MNSFFIGLDSNQSIISNEIRYGEVVDGYVNLGQAYVNLEETFKAIVCCDSRVWFFNNPTDENVLTAILVPNSKIGKSDIDDFVFVYRGLDRSRFIANSGKYNRTASEDYIFRKYETVPNFIHTIESLNFNSGFRKCFETMSSVELNSGDCLGRFASSCSFEMVSLSTLVTMEPHEILRKDSSYSLNNGYSKLSKFPDPISFFQNSVDNIRRDQYTNHQDEIIIGFENALFEENQVKAVFIDENDEVEIDLVKRQSGLWVLNINDSVLIEKLVSDTIKLKILSTGVGYSEAIVHYVVNDADSINKSVFVEETLIDQDCFYLNIRLGARRQKQFITTFIDVQFIDRGDEYSFFGKNIKLSEIISLSQTLADYSYKTLSTHVGIENIMQSGKVQLGCNGICSFNYNGNRYSGIWMFSYPEKSTENLTTNMKKPAIRLYGEGGFYKRSNRNHEQWIINKILIQSGNDELLNLSNDKSCYVERNDEDSFYSVLIDQNKMNIIADLANSIGTELENMFLLCKKLPIENTVLNFQLFLSYENDGNISVIDTGVNVSTSFEEV